MALIPKTSFPHRYVLGIRRYWKSSIGWFVGVWGAVWLLIESLTFLASPVLDFFQDYGLQALWALVAVSFVHVLWRLPVPVRIVLPIATTNTRVRIMFGDIFEEKDHIAIPVNEYFDGKLGKYVAQHSLHGQFIQRYFQGDSALFEARLDESLKSKDFKVTRREIDRNKSYPIGTTAVLEIGERKAFLFALSKTEFGTAKAKADVPMMWAALNGLWSAVRESSNGSPINVPLVGSGQSHVGFESSHLLRIILLTVLEATRQGEITKMITVILSEDLVDRIDLRALKGEWR